MRTCHTITICLWRTLLYFSLRVENVAFSYFSVIHCDPIRIRDILTRYHCSLGQLPSSLPPRRQTGYNVVGSTGARFRNFSVELSGTFLNHSECVENNRLSIILFENTMNNLLLFGVNVFFYKESEFAMCMCIGMSVDSIWVISLIIDKRLYLTLCDLATTSWVFTTT